MPFVSKIKILDFNLDLSSSITNKEVKISDLENVPSTLIAYNEEFEHFKKNPEAAGKLLGVGDSPREESLDTAEHAAWTIVASMLLNLDEVITRL